METDGMDATADVGGEAGERGLFFQIGFQRCGTTSIAAFFNRCGIACVHHDQGRLARRMRVNMEAGVRPLAGYDERYRAFTNINWNAADDYYDGFKHFAALRHAYGGRFILNVRPVEHWVRSVMSHKALRGRRLVESHYALRFGTTDLEEVAARWRAEWEAHRRRVLAEIPADELLVFDIESDPPERLCDFAGVPRACARFWTRENATLNPLGAVISRSVPLALKQRIPAPLKRPLKNLLAR